MAAHSITIIAISGSEVRAIVVDEVGTETLWPGLAPPQVIDQFAPAVRGVIRQTATEQVPDSAVDTFMADHVSVSD